MKNKVTWWIHGAGRICRGHDIIHCSIELNEDDVEQLIERDLASVRGSPSLYDFPSTSSKPIFSNFIKKHIDLKNESRHNEIANWGILNVKIEK